MSFVMIRSVSLALALLVPLLSSCRKPDEPRGKDALQPPAPVALPSPVATTHITAAETTALKSVDVPNDKPVLVIEGKPDDKRVLVHLHGMCTSARSDLEAWGGVVKEHGSVVALAGDVACPDGSMRWSEDATALDRRIGAAIEAVSAQRREKLDASTLVLLGESMGAARAELLAAKVPDRYARLVLIGSPQKASATRLKGAKAVANVAAENEPQENMRAGTKNLEGAGMTTRLFVLPGATHGEYGPEGLRVMNEAISFVADR